MGFTPPTYLLKEVGRPNVRNSSLYRSVEKGLLIDICVWRLLRLLLLEQYNDCLTQCHMPSQSVPVLMLPQMLLGQEPSFTDLHTDETFQG